MKAHEMTFEERIVLMLALIPHVWPQALEAPDVLEEIEYINTLIRHSRPILEDWGLGKAIKPGYRNLFYGPPSMGKTLTAPHVGATAGGEKR